MSEQPWRIRTELIQGPPGPVGPSGPPGPASPVPYVAAIDLGSLVPGDLADPSWSFITPSASVSVTQNVALPAQLDGFVDAVLVNPQGNATGSGYLQRQFVVPPNTTQIALTGTMQLPPGVGSATVRLAIGAAPYGSNLVFVDAVLTGSYATFTTPTLAVTPGTTYTAVLIFNNTGNQASALVSRVAVSVVSSTDALFTGSFVRLEPLPSLWRYNAYLNLRLSSGGIIPAQQYWFTSPYAQLDFETNAVLLGFEQANNLAGFPTGATIRIDVNGRFFKLLTLPTNVATVVEVALPAGIKRVTVWRGSAQGGGAVNWPSNFDSMGIINALYVNAGAYISNFDTTRAKIALYGDSKLNGALATWPMANGVPGQLRRISPNAVAFDTGNGRALADESITRFVNYLAAYKTDIIMIGIGRNDWSLNTYASAAAFGTAFGALLDAVRLQAPGCQIVCLTPSSETGEAANTAASPYTLADIRHQMALAVANRMPGNIRLVDLSAAWGVGTQASTYTADGTHPNDLGSGIIANAILGVDSAGIVQQTMTTPLALPGLVAWHPGISLQHTGGVVTSWLDLSGNGNHLTAQNAPTYIQQDINGRPVCQLVSGSSQYLNKTNVALFGSQMSAWIVVKVDAFPAGNPRWWHHGNVATGSGLLTWSAGSGRALTNNGSNYELYGANTSNYEIWSISWTSGSIPQLRINGTAIAPTGSSGSLVNIIAPALTDVFVLGAAYQGSSTYANYGSVHIAESIIANVGYAPGSQWGTMIDRYLETKYNFTVL